MVWGSRCLLLGGVPIVAVGVAADGVRLGLGLPFVVAPGSAYTLVVQRDTVLETVELCCRGYHGGLGWGEFSVPFAAARPLGTVFGVTGWDLDERPAGGGMWASPREHRPSDLRLGRNRRKRG